MALYTVAFILAFLHLANLTPLFLPKEEYHFKQWMLQYNKVYDLEEYYHRLDIFTRHKRRIDYHNAGKHTFSMGLNQFSDMSFAEFRKTFLLTEPQGHCGSCWTFSTTGCLESVTAIATGKLPLLSEQQLVDCAQDFNNHGCMGGLPSQAFEYVKYNNGLMTEDDYPYTGHDGSCNFKPELAAAFVKDVVNITSYDEKGMVDAVARLNPVSFGYEVTDDFLHYKDGVYSSTTCKNTTDNVNHAVLAVGYGEKNSTPYWIVKNSWGTNWGMDGYFLIERGRNMCGLAACSSYPLPPV
ncbi:pro-cathepsin H isoform X3 [Salmo salar]|uniref:Pro-cathepsin H isoform X3 n=1 Tax=Salmo salar TaxID=8030 RepID=A0ABM3CFH2_SALSA|nr:pro-cathepsin H isoform X3 [Salmo salar]